MRWGQTDPSLSRRREIRVCPAPHSKLTPQHFTYDIRTRTDGFLKASVTRKTCNNVGAYSAAWDRALAQRIPRVSLTRTAITKITLPIRTLPPQPPSLLPLPPPLAGKLDQRRWYARNLPRSTFRERAFPPGAPLPPPHCPPLTRPIPVVVRRSLRLVAVVVVESCARSRAASFAGDHGESWHHDERTRVRECRPTHTDPPIYLLIQCNSMRLSHAYTPLARSLARSFRLSSSSLSPFFTHIQSQPPCKHLAPPVRNARASLTLGGLYPAPPSDFFRLFFLPRTDCLDTTSANASSGFRTILHGVSWHAHV